jgi:hypothetical protein
MTGDELKHELQCAGLSHIDAAKKVFGVDPLILAGWIAGKIPIPDGVAAAAKRKAARTQREKGHAGT